MPVAPLGPDTAALAIRLLGGLQLRRGDQLLPHPFPTRKSASLFAFLLLHPRAEHSRRFLAGTFWPDVDEDAALRSLAAALVPIRKLLEPLPQQKGAFLISHRDMLRLIPPPDCWVDVRAFQHAGSAASDARAGSPEWFDALEAAVALYEGDLLPDHGDDWCTALREELRERLLDYLRQLTDAEEERRQYRRGCEWARRALGADRCHEASHRSLMRLDYRLGEYAKALHQYRECRRVLLEELDAPPSAETIALYQWLRAQRDRDEGVPHPDVSPLPDHLDLMVPLVGRDRELERLHAGWERARTGRGELLLLIGEAGIGKSRLGRQLLQGVVMAGGLALYGQASALESSSLYRPLIDPLRRALELAQEQRLTLCEPVWLAQVARLLPELPRGEPSLAMPEGESPRLLEEGILQLLLALAAQRPLCLFLDDLHWVDAASGRFLHYLAHESRQARILLIGAYREGEVPGSDWLGPWVTEVQAPGLATALPLARLDEEEVARLLRQLAEGHASEALVRALGERLYEETEGNPLFLLETLRDLFDRDYLVVSAEGRWQIGPDPLAPPESARTEEPENVALLARRLPVPATVQRVVHQRVSRLGEEDRQLLQCAAVIGRRFTFEALRRSAGREIEATLAGVERLLAADLISAQAHPATFDFRHDKIREVVYEDLLPIRRQALHRRVGEALEEIYNVAREAEIEDSRFPIWFRRPPLPARARAEEHAEELAYHFHQAAGLIGPEKAVRYYILAGTRARAFSAYEQAVGELLTAQLLLGDLPAETARLALWEQIAEQLAPAYLGTGVGEAARAVLQDTIDLCEQHRYALGTARGCTLMGQFFEVYPIQADAEPSLGMYERAIAVCQAHGLEDSIIYPQSHLAFRLVWLGSDLQRAEALARACLTRAKKHPDTLLLQRLYSALIWSAAKQGNLKDVKEAFQASLAWGGPFEMPLEETLAHIEETCHRSASEESFIDLCREMAAGYARAGLEAPLQQWYLVPASPALTPGDPVLQEDFEGEYWNPSMLWQDITGRSRFDRVSRPGWLGLWPAEGGDLWPESNLKAPRLMTTVRGDFVAQTRVELGQRGKTMAGLLVWRDAQHFVRLELRDDFSQRTAIHLHACEAARFRSIGRGQCERRPMWLRVERVGAEIRGLCSEDGDHWLACGSVRLPAGETEQVGLAAIHQQPGAHAWFDTFLLWRG